MEWYTGSIEQAIKQVRENNSLLCVLVKDDKPASIAMLESVSNAAHIFRGFTSIQLVLGTPTCQQFSVYYPVLVVPSLYLISGSGVCLAVIADKDKITSIVADVTKNKDAVPQPTATPPSQAATSADISNTVTPEDIAQKIVRAEALRANGSSLAAGTSSAAGASSADLSLEERQQKARSLIEEKQRKDAFAAQETEKQKEKERRDAGQALINNKRRNEAEAMKRHSESIRKDKITQKAEMEAIRAQIARDKAERRGETYSGPEVSTAPVKTAVPVQEGTVRLQIKFPATDTTLVRTFQEEATLGEVVEYAKEELNKANFTLWNTFPRKQYKAADLPLSLKALGLKGNVGLLGMSGKGYSPSPAQQPGKSDIPTVSAGHVSEEKSESPLTQSRIQFKRPDGSSLLHIFDIDTLLVDVIKHFESQCNDLGNSVLWSLYPRYEISHEHVSKTLSELDMCPSAVIFAVSPTTGAINQGNQVSTTSSSMIWELLLTLLQLPITVLEYIKNLLFPAPARTRPIPPPLSPEPTVVPQFREDDPSEGNVRKRTKLDGNVTRLSDRKEEEEDDSNTWNGNSTQLQ